MSYNIMKFSKKLNAAGFFLIHLPRHAILKCNPDFHFLTPRVTINLGVMTWCALHSCWVMLLKLSDVNV